MDFEGGVEVDQNQPLFYLRNYGFIEGKFRFYQSLNEQKIKFSPTLTLVNYQ